MDDDAFPVHAGRLGGLPCVEAVTLGGSRAEGTHRPDSDWDFSIYYRGRFDPRTLRDIGWPGEVFEVGGWSGGAAQMPPSLRAVVPRAAAAAGPVRWPGRPGRQPGPHAVLAARGEWITNEKTLLTRAGLRQVDELVAAARPAEDALSALVDRTRAICLAALREARG